MTFKEYQKIAKTGKSAEGWVAGSLRGGYGLDGIFYALGANGMVFQKAIAEVSDYKEN